jgi:hypothetical protein
MQIAEKPGRLSARSRVKLALCCFFALVALTVSARQSGAVPSTRQNQSDFRIASGTGSVKVPFELFGNNILIQIRINHSRPIWFIFDTGASINVINERMVKSLGLTPKGAVNLNGGGGSVGGTTIEGTSISLPGVEAFNQTIAAIPLDALSAYSGRNIQGLVGNNFIQNFVVEIDYAKQTLIFHDPQTYNLANSRDAIEIVNRGGIPYVKAEISPGGRNTITDLFEIDTGSNGIFSINRPFAEKHQLLKIIPQANMVEGIGGAGVGGEMKNIDARIDSVRLGQYILSKPVVSISQDEEGIGASADAGFIGTDLLRRFTLIIDYQSHRMKLLPNTHFQEPFEIDMSGLELWTEPNNFKAIKIKKVRANFPAAQAGLRDDDEVVAINGRPASGFDLDKLMKMFKQEGKAYLLTVKRGNQLIKAKLRMRRTI